MYNKKFRKIYAGCALAMTLTIAATPISAFAEEPTHTEVNSIAPDAENKADDPKSLTGIDPTNTTGDDPNTDKVEKTYADTDIDVWGYTKNTVVYSVDVEWGAMTFEYEASKWHPETHTKGAGAGWKVYDSATDEVVEGAQDAINRVTVTNHSNAKVYAEMSYNGIDATADGGKDYTGITGKFADTSTASENVKATWDGTKNCFTLQTAATDASGGDITTPDTPGTPSKGNVYFTPQGITADKTIDKWTKIGKITVAISTEAPTATPVVP